jgi:hypothetical protein
MSDDRFLNELNIEQQLFKDTNLLLKKKESLNKSLLLSLNETNDHLNKLFLNIIQRQNRLFNYLQQQNDRCMERQTLENLLNQILSKENLLIDKLKRIYVKLNAKKRRRKKTFQLRNKSEEINISINDIKQVTHKNDQESFQIKFNPSNDEILKIYWRSISSNNLFEKPRFCFMRKSSSDTYLGNNINKCSLFKHFSASIHWDFPKLAKINRIHPRTTIS